MSTDDFVNGIVIGRVAGMVCRVFYDGRPQGKHFEAETDAEAKTIAENYISALKSKYGEVFKLIFPHDCWEVRIYQ